MRGIKKLCILLSICICSVFFVCPLKKIHTEAATIVYITDTGKKYHGANCHYLNSSKKAISLSVALSRGYTACSYCHGEAIYYSLSTSVTKPNIVTSNSTSENDTLFSTGFYIAVFFCVYVVYMVIHFSKDKK